MNESLLQKIQAALQLIAPMAEKAWIPAQSILRLLKWCEKSLLGQPVEPRPKPFSMGLFATREFDMDGNQPDLGLLINENRTPWNRFEFRFQPVRECRLWVELSPSSYSYN